MPPKDSPNKDIRIKGEKKSNETFKVQQQVAGHYWSFRNRCLQTRDVCFTASDPISASVPLVSGLKLEKYSTVVFC